MTSEQIAIREAFDALCEYQSPSSSDERKKMALVRCWQVLATAIQPGETSSNRLNNWRDGCEEELA